MKKFICMVLAILMFTMSVSAATVDNKALDTLVIDGVTYAPLAKLAESMELSLVFEPGLAILYANENRLGLQLTIQDGAVRLPAEVNDIGDVTREHDDIVLPAPVKMIDSALYVPLRAVCEAYGARVYWTEERGAWVERARYNKPTLIRVGDGERQVVTMPEYFQAAKVIGDKIYYKNQTGVYSMDMSGENKEKLANAGSWSFKDNSLVVLENDGTLLMIALDGEERQVISDCAEQFMRLQDKLMLCVEKEATVIRDYEGNIVHTLGDSIYYFLDMKNDKFYYIDKQRQVAVSDNPIGENATALTGTVYYATIVDGYIYYVGDGASLRRIDMQTNENQLVYGLALEYVETVGDKYLFNYYAETKELTDMFIANPDGSQLQPYSDTAMAANECLYANDGMYVLSYNDNRLYFVKNRKAEAVSEDTVNALVGFHDGWIYYVVG